MRWLILLIASVVAAPLAAGYDPMATNTNIQYAAPSIEHPFGTDLLGRDVWSRVAVGGWRTFGIAALASGIALLPGLTIGLILSNATRRVNQTSDIVLNALLAFPSLIIALIILTLVGQSALSLALAVGIAQIAPTVRVIRGAAQNIHTMGYYEAGRALGASPLHMSIVHVLPNIAPTLFAYAGVVFSYSLLNSAALSFLGIGGEPGIPDWGVMLAEGRQAFRTAPWVAFAPGTAITVSVMIVNRAADQLARHPRK